MDFVVRLFSGAAGQTLLSLSHNWPFLLASVLIAGALKVFADADKVSAFLRRSSKASVAAATLVAVATPLCSCGTTAVVLGMLASTMPWAPIVAFMVASPLSSPEGMVYSAGLFGWGFALYHFAASIALGLAGGVLAAALQKAGFLEGQARAAGRAAKAPMRQAPAEACSCGAPAAKGGPAAAGARFAPIAARAMLAPLAVSAGGGGGVAEAACCGSSPSAGTKRARALESRLQAFGLAILDTGKTILPMFLGFAFLGYLLNGLIPASVVSSLFGQGRIYGVPLAATLGLPLYVNSEASMPLARALMDSGMSPGSILAFLIAGSGTSVGAIGGALTIARWRVVGLVVAVLWAGAIAAGYGFDALRAIGLI